MTFDTKIQNAIDRLKLYERKALENNPKGFYLAFSGGKDSVVVDALCKMAGVKYERHYSNTTIDPPELIYFMRKHYPETIWEHQPRPFLKELVYRGAPRRQSRWCCAIYKEGGGAGRYVLTGLRWAESHRRATTRKMFEACYKDSGRFTLNPIIDWTERDVWLFIGKHNIPYCDLYETHQRLGCLFCPMAKQKSRDADVVKYPKFVEAFIRAYEACYQDRKTRGITEGIRNFANGREMWDWWISGLSVAKWCAKVGKEYAPAKQKPTKADKGGE